MAKPRTFPDEKLTEACPRLDVYELYRMRALRSSGRIQRWSCDGTEVLIETGRDQIRVGDQIVAVEHEHFGSTRPKFRCSECDAGCRVLYERAEDGLWTCRRCAGLDYRSRRHKTSASYDVHQMAGELERKYRG